MPRICPRSHLNTRLTHGQRQVRIMNKRKQAQAGGQPEQSSRLESGHLGNGTLPAGRSAALSLPACHVRLPGPTAPGAGTATCLAYLKSSFLMNSTMMSFSGWICSIFRVRHRKGVGLMFPPYTPPTYFSSMALSTTSSARIDGGQDEPRGQRQAAQPQGPSTSHTRRV